MAETGFQTQQPGADARRAASEAASKGAEVVRHAADQAKDIGAKAGEQLKSGAQQQSAQMGGALHTLASKLEETSGQVDSKWVGSIVGQAANSLHSAASYFETSRPEALFSDFTHGNRHELQRTVRARRLHRRPGLRLQRLNGLGGADHRRNGRRDRLNRFIWRLGLRVGRQPVDGSADAGGNRCRPLT
jgi:hypothetical protein